EACGLQALDLLDVGEEATVRRDRRVQTDAVGVGEGLDELRGEAGFPAGEANAAHPAGLGVVDGCAQLGGGNRFAVERGGHGAEGAGLVAAPVDGQDELAHGSRGVRTWPSLPLVRHPARAWARPGDRRAPTGYVPRV